MIRMFTVLTASAAHYNYSLAPLIHLHCWMNMASYECFTYLLTYSEEKDCCSDLTISACLHRITGKKLLVIHHCVQPLHDLNNNAMQADCMSKWASK